MEPIQQLRGRRIVRLPVSASAARVVTRNRRPGLAMRRVPATGRRAAANAQDAARATDTEDAARATDA
jgi:hypothetical protein